MSIPVIGQGTWKFGEDLKKEKDEIEALRYGIRNGLTLIVKSDVFLVTKVSAKNCSYKGVLRAAEASLNRLKTDYRAG